MVGGLEGDSEIVDLDHEDGEQHEQDDGWPTKYPFVSL